MVEQLYLGDTHVHSTRSDGRLSPAELARVACARDLDFLALTDHPAHGAHPQEPAAPPAGTPTLLPGQEVSAGGHVHFVLLGCAPAPSGRIRLEDLRRLADQVHAAGGVVVLAHPWTAFARSVEVVQQLDAAFASSTLDGLEIFSGALLPADHHLWRRMLDHYLREWAPSAPALLGSSDWHRRAHGRSVGCACTGVLAASPAPGDLLAGLAARRTVAVWQPVAALEDGLSLEPGRPPVGDTWPPGLRWDRHLCGAPELVNSLLAEQDEVERQLSTARAKDDLQLAARSACAAGNLRRARALLDAAERERGIGKWR